MPERSPYNLVDQHPDSQQRIHIRGPVELSEAEAAERNKHLAVAGLHRRWLPAIEPAADPKPSMDGRPKK